MAKKPEEKKDALATQEVGGAMAARPSFIPTNDSRGTEHIGKDDVRMPRIRIAEKGSPQIDETESSFVEGLAFGDLFNDLTNTIYGRGPIEFVIIRADKPRWVHFAPRSEGGGVLDFDVKPGDPKTQWRNTEEGRKPPIATQFYDYVVMLYGPDKPYHRELVALSLKSTSLKAAKRLNGLIKTRSGSPLFASKYVLTAGIDKNSKGTFGSYGFRCLGWITEEEDYRFAEAAFESLKNKNIVIEREAGDEDTFDADELEEEGTEQTGGM